MDHYIIQKNSSQFRESGKVFVRGNRERQRHMTMNETERRRPTYLNGLLDIPVVLLPSHISSGVEVVSNIFL